MIKTTFWARVAGFVLTLGLASGGCVRFVDALVPNTAITFQSLEANSGVTSVLTLTFERAVTGLSVADITLIDTDIQKSELIGPVVGADGSATYRLSVSGITKNGKVTVRVEKAGCVFTPIERTVQVQVQAPLVPAVPITFQSLKADDEGTEFTSALMLTFDKAVPGLSVADITLTDTGGTGIQKGELATSGVGSAVYRLSVSGITKSGEVTVKVTKAGYTFTPPERTVQVQAPPAVPITFQSLKADDEGTEFTSALMLTFDKAVTGLSVADITLTDTGGTSIQKGELATSGVGSAVYRLSVSGITKSGTVTVKVTKAGYTFTPIERTVQVQAPLAPVVPIAFSLKADDEGTEFTSALMLTFDKAVSGLSVADITLTDTGGTGIQKGELATSGGGSAVYRLSVFGITKSGNVSVKVTKAGYTFTPSERTVQVQAPLAPPVPIAFSLKADDEGTEFTSALMLTFDKAVSGLSVADITLIDTDNTGIQKGELAASGVGSVAYRLSVSGITKSGNVSVKVTKAGYAFTPPERTVQVQAPLAPAVPIAFQSLKADDEGTEFTSALTLTFDKAVSGLSVADITLTDTDGTGIQKGELAASGVGSVAYRLSVFGITKSGTVTVKVTKAGYTFTPSERTVQVQASLAPPVPIAFQSLRTNGVDNRYPTSMLILEFSQTVPELSAADITLTDTGGTGIQKGELMAPGVDPDGKPFGYGEGVYGLSVSGITKSGNVSVRVEKAGYTFTQAEQSVKVHFVSVTFQSVEADGTRALALKFNKAVFDLSAADITLIDPDNTGIQKGGEIPLFPEYGADGSAVYRLPVSGIMKSGTVTVKVARDGWAFTPAEQSVWVHVVQIAFQSLGADGGRFTEPTTALTLKFDQAVPGLSAADITLIDTDRTGIQKYALTALGGGAYRLSVSVFDRNGDVTVKVTGDGWAFTPAEQSVWVWSSPVAFSLEADGSSAEATAELRLKFDRDVPDLLDPNVISITLDDIGGTDIQKGELTALGKSKYRLAVNGIHRNGDVRITLSAGERYVFAPFVAETYVYRGPLPKPAAFTVTADGGIAASTTELKLVFNWNAKGLPLKDITLEDPEGTGIQKVSLAGYSSSSPDEANYTLFVDGITKSGTVTVKVAPQTDYYTYTPGPQEVQVYAFEPVTAKFESVSTDGPGSAPTTVLYLKFDKDIPYLTAEDIMLEDPWGTGVQKGLLVHTAPGAYSLAVDGVTKSGEIRVWCVFTMDTHTVRVYAPPAFLSLSADGRDGAAAARLSPADIMRETLRRRRHK